MMKKIRTVMHYFLHDMKFKYKFMITHLMLVLVPTLVVFLFLYGRLSHIITDHTIESEQALVSQTADTLEATVSQLRLSMDSITSNPFLSEATYTSDVYGYLSENRNSPRALEFFSNINALIDHEFITAVKIYIPTKEKLPVSFSGFVSSVDDVSGSYWHGIFAGRPSMVSLLCPSFYLTSGEINDRGSLAFIQKFTNLANADGECSYIAIYFSKQYLENILRDNLTGTNSVYYLINSRNSLVVSSDTVLAATYYKRYEAIPDAVGSVEEFATTTILDENLYMGYRDIDRTDWRLVSIIPVNNIFTEGRQLLINTALLYLVFVALACATALFLSGSLARRLSLVVEKINQNREKSLVPFEDDSDRDEIGQLVSNYNAMVDRINQLMREQTETAEKLKVSEVKALQAQINPHFLYNMLDMINWLAQSGKQKEVSIAVQTLSKFYKLTLSKKNITTSIREELRHVELYVQLQNMRYEDKISFLIDVPDEIMDFEIPKLVLQPIVENSIQHGIFEKESKEGSIVIMAWMENEDIVFVISDNGIGIPDKKLPLLLDGTYEDGKGSNIGIYNTHLRLQLLYGRKYGLHYESTLGKGTEVQVKLPASEHMPSYSSPDLILEMAVGPVEEIDGYLTAQD